MNFLRIGFLQIRFAIEAVIEHFVPVVLKAVVTALGLGILSVMMFVGIWQGSILAFGREAAEYKAADVIASSEAIRISIDGSWHWAPAVQSKIAEAWVFQNCKAEFFDVYVTDVGNDSVVISCERGQDKSKDVVFRTSSLEEENLGKGVSGLSFLYGVGEVRVTPVQLLSSWVTQLFS